MEIQYDSCRLERRNRPHLRKTKEACRSPKPGLVAGEGTVQPDQQSISLPE